MSLSTTSTKTTCTHEAVSNVPLMLHELWDYLKARLVQFLCNKSTADVATAEMNSFETHVCVCRACKL